jgi:hypothetical protein
MAELLPITDYASLKAAIPAWADRTDSEYINSVPVFISQAESRIFRNLRCPGNEKIVFYGADDYDNTHGVTLANTYLECKWIVYGDTPLERISDQRYLAFSAQSAVAAPPIYFARLEGALAFYPHASENADVRMCQYESQGPLSATETWTRMLRVSPEIYLYGALAEGARFLRDEAETQMWDTRFDQAMQSLSVQAYDNEVAGSTVVVSDLSGGAW